MNKEEKEWFYQCVRLAQNEMLEYTTPPLDYAKVMAKAKIIYSEGLKNAKELLIATETFVNKNVKICPKCSEEVPIGYNKHSYKKDGTMCGHIFK